VQPRDPDDGSMPERREETRQEAQVRLILERYRDRVEPGPETWQETGVEYFVRKDFVLVPDELAPRVRDLLRRAGRLPDPDDEPRQIKEEPLEDDREPGEDEPPEDGDVQYGVQWIRLRPDAGVLSTLRIIRRAFGTDAGAPEFLVHITSTGGSCPADEPVPVAAGSAPDPAVAADRGAGTGIRVVILDTGFDDRTAALPWLRGVRGDGDPGISGNTLFPYAGHGTFIAGVVRSIAPGADVIVRRAFRPLGVVFEKDLVQALGRTLRLDSPDVISLSAGTTADCVNGPYLLNRFYDRTLQRYKGVAVVAAAGNDAQRKQFWPAASPWTVSVGALASDGRSRAHFSNFGGWVDVYAPGQHLINAFPEGTLTYQEPPRAGTTATFSTMASWSGTSFSTPVVAGLIAARMSRTGENGRDAAAALVAQAQAAARPGIGAVLLPDGPDGPCAPHPHPRHCCHEHASSRC
jgi:subtilisin family serine protease